MANLFKKAVIFTDIHIGLKTNSITHNEDCLAFAKWMIEKAKEEGCETCLFLGDFHNNRASINILTLNYSLQILELLSSSFSNTFFIPGNHDLYYRDKRDIQSVEWARHIPNITIVNDWFKESNVIIAPWLVGSDHKKIKQLKGDYVFGHFELPHFYMNAMIQMPDHGEIKREDFVEIGHVYSGHFHKRQSHNNITYVGNCFPHNYADANDDFRGIGILEWGKPIVYHSWPDQPVYRVYQLSQLIEAPEKLLSKKMHARIHLDIDVSYEEANFIKETFTDTYGLRELTLMPVQRTELTAGVTGGNVTFESVDQIVAASINNIESDHYEPAMLLSIYNNL